MPKVREEVKLLTEKEEEEKARNRTRGPYRKARADSTTKHA